MGYIVHREEFMVYELYLNKAYTSIYRDQKVMEVVSLHSTPDILSQAMAMVLQVDVFLINSTKIFLDGFYRYNLLWYKNEDTF